MRYAQLTNREIEYVPLSKDVTDGDLKQRREIAGGSAFYVDQAAVRAATEGRILVLDGIEKAERNVLPIINNLLENREMALGWLMDLERTVHWSPRLNLDFPGTFRGRKVPGPPQEVRHVGKGPH
jgi:hypothetical protein